MGGIFLGNCSPKLFSFWTPLGFQRGEIWCNNEGVIGSEGVKRGKNWSAMGVKECKIEGVFFQRGVVNDVRMGLQWRNFFGNCSSKLLPLFGLH